MLEWPVLLGNLARELFDDPDFFADTLRLPRDVVRGIATIWKTLTSGLPIGRFHLHSR